MKWFHGEVGEAIASAKANKTLFVVFVCGGAEDEMTKKLTSVLENPEVGSMFDSYVNFKIEKDTTTFTQFNQLYAVFLVPSIFYIDSESGMDVEITVCPQEDKDILAGLERAKTVLQQRKAQQEAASTPSTSVAAAIPSDQNTTPSNIVESFAIQPSSSQDTASSSVAQSSASQDATSDSSQPSSSRPAGEGEGQLSLQERERRVRMLIQQKKEEKEKAEKEKEKEREMDRRNLGKTMQEMKRKQEEDEMKEAALERKKNKEEERLARERVKAAIEEDRAERAAKYNAEKKAEVEKRKEKERAELAAKAADAERLAAQRSSVSRIQFRLPDGRGQTKQFDADEPLGTLYEYVDSELNTGFSSFSLSTAFPKRDLDAIPKATSLREAELVPSSTVLVLPGSSSLSVSGGPGSMQSIFWLLLTPLTLLWAGFWGLVLSLTGGGDQSASNQNQGPASASGVRSHYGAQAASDRNKRPASGRMRTLNDLRGNEDDEDNNTYNGNTTQQQ